MAQYKVKLVMSEEYIVRAESKEEAEKLARGNYGCDYYIDSVEVTELEEDDKEFECPHDFCSYCEHQKKCYPNGIEEGDFFYHEGFLVSDPMDV